MIRHARAESMLRLLENRAKAVLQFVMKLIREGVMGRERK